MNVYLRTFGCRANQYDTEAVRALVESSGHTIVDAIDAADAAVFNSCAVTSSAEAELRKVVRKAARERPGLKSVVMGCAAALDADRPRDRQIKTLPTVHAVVAGADLAGVANALDLQAVPVGALTRHQSGTRALLRIQDGCDEHCTFCATTLARGANRSRDLSALIDEASALARHHAEIVVTGIHIGTYGRDIGTTLGRLMSRLVDAVADVRFRLTSIEATEVDDDLLGLMADAPRRLAPNIHAPLQSGSDAVLKRMGRHWYTAASYGAAVARMADRLPVFGLGADIITGFPGETEADHAATATLVRELPFTYLHVFPYSPRPGTAAIKLGNPVSPAVARRRAEELRSLGAAKAADHARRRDAQVADVVVIGGGSPRRGLTEDYLEIELADPSPGRGERVDVRLEMCGGTLLGRPAR
jgi:threonylcarbamoyladenosine tRNA methylthiotransferase MtaB